MEIRVTNNERYTCMPDLLFYTRNYNYSTNCKYTWSNSLTTATTVTILISLKLGGMDLDRDIRNVICKSYLGQN